MHHSTERLIHTKTFATPVVEHWLEQEIALWWDQSDDPAHHEQTLYHKTTPCSRLLNNMAVRTTFLPHRPEDLISLI